MGYQGTPALCGIEVVELQNVAGLGAITVSGDEVAWLALSDTTLGIGRRSAVLAKEEWQSEFAGYESVGDSPLNSNIGTLAGGGFFFRSPTVKQSFLCWPGAPCETVAAGLEIRHLRARLGRLAVAAGPMFCNLELVGNDLQAELKSTLEALSSESTGCESVSANASNEAERVDFADADSARVWLTTSSEVLVTGPDGALSATPIGFEVRATAAALACDENPRVLLFKQCPPPEMCTLNVVDAPTGASQPPSPSPVDAGPIPVDSVIAADRDYFYYSTKDLINVVTRPGGSVRKVELNGSSRITSMDASHEDYLFFTYEETIGPLKKYFLGRWLKQKLTPAATP